MVSRWTNAAKKSLSGIQSSHFTKEETKKYKQSFVRRIEDRIRTVMESMPSTEPGWQGTYKILVDWYKVYYSFSADKQVCYVEALKHQRQE